MKDSNYPGMDDEEASPSETPETSEHSKGEEEGETALLPKSLFGGKDPKPGEEYVFEVVRSYEGEVEIKYSTKPEGESEPDEDDAHSKLEAMGSESNPGASGGGY